MQQCEKWRSHCLLAFSPLPPTTFAKNSSKEYRIHAFNVCFFLANAGDALGTYPENSAEEVEFLLQTMRCDGNMLCERPSWAYHGWTSDIDGEKPFLRYCRVYFNPLLLRYSIKHINNRQRLKTL